MSATTRRDGVLCRWRAIDGLGANGLLVARSYRSELQGVFTRAGTKLVLDRNGVLATVPHSVPAFTWINSEPALLLEAAATNLVIRSDEFDNAAWAKSAVGAGTAPAVTANAATAPDGTLTADRVVFIAPASGDNSALTSTAFTTTAASVYAGSVWIKAAAAADVGKILLFRHVGASGYTSITLTAAWQRVQAHETALGVSSTFGVDLRPALGASTGTVTADLWRAQVELGSAATSEIQTTSAAASRVADALYFPHLAIPQVSTVYVRGIEKMRANVAAPATTGILHIGNAASTEARLFWYRAAAEAGYRFQHDPVSAGTQTSNLGTAAAIDSPVELRGVLNADGSVTGGVSVNSGAETTNGPTTAQAIVSAWSDQRLYLNAFGSGSAGAFAFTHVVIAAGTKTLAEMRALAEVG